ncbi:MAG: hypothetical protein LH478_13075, partial [Chitinophagaceae bacterium]|nr:hypothetical protein [Chitinophagaceae bacterium]
MTSKQEEPYNFSSICNHYLVTMNANEHITFCNSNFSNKFYNDPVTSTITSLIQEEYVHSFKNHFKVCIATPGKCIQGTSVLINQLDGPHHIKWEMVAEVQKSRDVNVYLVGHDLHKNLHGDSGVDLSLKILKAIFDSIDAVKFFISPNLRIQFFNNPAFEKYLKLHGKRMKIGDNILEYVRDTENKIEQDFLIDFDKAVKGETVISEKEIKYKHDKSKCFRTKYYPVYEEGNLIGVSV